MKYHIAVVDDDPLNLKAADRILSFQGNRISCISSGEELLKFLESDTPDAILLDVHMEGIDGFETLSRLQMSKKNRDIPVIFLTADTDGDTETRALALGAADFVAKPFIPSVLVMRVSKNIEYMRLQKDLKNEVSKMTEEIVRQHERNEKLSLQIVKTLAGTIDAKDIYTSGHSGRVAEYSKEIARRAGYSERAQEEIYMIGLLHDVGKIGVPDEIINKPTFLEADEYEQIKRHATMGFDILKNISEMPKLAVGARWHHERYDGSGYPDGLKGEDIPEEARIIAVADAYDAMSSHRSYHDVFAQQYIIEEFERCKGEQFDQRFADIMLEMIAEDTEFEMRETTNDAVITVHGEKDVKPDENTFRFLAMLDVGQLNTALGMKYCMNDVAFYKEMLDEFVTEYEERIEKLNTAFANGDMQKYKVYVHSLKSASRMIGAEKISEAAEKLEEAAAAADTGFVGAHHDELITYLKSTVSGILMAGGIMGE